MYGYFIQLLLMFVSVGFCSCGVVFNYLLGFTDLLFKRERESERGQTQTDRQTEKSERERETDRQRDRQMVKQTDIELVIVC